MVVTCLASRSVTALRKLCRALPHSAAFHRTLRPSKRLTVVVTCLAFRSVTADTALRMLYRALPHSAAFCRTRLALPLICNSSSHASTALGRAPDLYQLLKTAPFVWQRTSFAV